MSNKEAVIRELIKSYWMEFETVINYLSISVNLDGGRAEEIKKALAADVVSVIEGVIEAEECAIAQYNKIIKMCEGVDYVTQDLCIRLLAEEESHRVEFSGYLKEYKK